MIHFMTIVHNGQPFIKHHIETFKKLSMPWKWHIAEGLSELKGCTAWSVARGGRIDDSMHEDGLSNDGTHKYLADMWTNNKFDVSLYFPIKKFWEGKCQMCNRICESIHEPGLLWQIDVDEFWTSEQIETMYRMFTLHPERTAAWFWAKYYVGRDRVISTRNCYANNSAYEWIRVWNFTPGMRFAAHEPPVLRDQSGEDVARKRPFVHAETEAAGLVFKHYAYCTPQQLAFKELYYGYGGAIQNWNELQQCTQFPARLRNYLPWVGDEALVEKVQPGDEMPF